MAGGTGSRLFPATSALNKHLLPVYDKPMIYYPLCTLMSIGVTDILIITNSRDIPAFTRLLGDGSHWGLNLSYKAQDKPRGIAEAFLIGEDHIAGSRIALMLGDNIFHGPFLDHIVQHSPDSPAASIFAYAVPDPSAYGVVELDAEGQVTALSEKPPRPTSHFAIPGLYFYSGDVVDRAKSLRPSSRGELEITDVNRTYLDDGLLKATVIPPENLWADAGTPDTLLEASHRVQALEREGHRIGSVDALSWKLGLIDDAQLRLLAEKHSPSPYARALASLAG